MVLRFFIINLISYTYVKYMVLLLCFVFLWVLRFAAQPSSKINIEKRKINFDSRSESAPLKPLFVSLFSYVH